jgi:probable HAF family extracellular repeat protein
MPSTAHRMGRVSGRLRLAVAGAVVLTALTAGTAAASGSAARSGASATPPAGPRSGTPVFVLDLTKGRFSGFDVPGPAPQDITRINNRGQVVGGTREAVADEGFRGYLRDRRGRITRIDVPGAAGTQPNDLNDHGQIVGTYSTTNSCTGCADDKRGFLRDRHGRYTTIHVPGALQSQAYGINNRGQVVGDYRDASGRVHGYLWDKGRFRTVDVPGAGDTTATDLNDRGQLIGVYSNDRDLRSPVHGFVLQRGRYASFDAPGAVLWTLPFGINNRGQIVGFTTDGPGLRQSQEIHGFLLAKGAGGPFTGIDVPGAPATGATGINDRGQIVGLYANPEAPPGPPSTSTPMGRMS